MPSPSTLADAGDAVLDPQAVANLRALDPSGVNRLLERVVKAFESSVDKLMPQLRDALAAANGDGVRHVAHTLKSSSASVGASQLSRTCAELETRIRVDGAAGLAASDELVERLFAQVEGARRALRAQLELPA